VPGSNLWLSRLQSYPAVATRIAHPSFRWKSRLNYQALAFYEQALRLPADNFPYKGPQRKTDLVPIHSPLDPPNFTVTTFIKGCSRSDRDRCDTAADFLRCLPTTDVVVWTDGSAPSPLGAGDTVAAIHRFSKTRTVSRFV